MTRWDEEMVVLTVKNGGVLEGWWMEGVEVMVVEMLKFDQHLSHHRLLSGQGVAEEVEGFGVAFSHEFKGI